MRVRLIYRVLPMYLIVLGMFVLPVWQRNEAKAEALQSAKLAQARLEASRTVVPTVKGTPSRIVLPRLGIDLPIVSGSYNSNASEWTVAGLVANYADNTALLNNRHDKTLVYGHWTKRVFGNTKNLTPGDVAYVYTDNGHVFKYQFIRKQMISPSDIQIFREFKGKPGLVLMTCDGAWAQNRRLMYFNLAAAS